MSSNRRFQRFVVKFEQNLDVNLPRVKKCFDYENRFQYISIYKSENTHDLYIQTKSDCRMYEKSIKRYIHRIGKNFVGPLYFNEFEGECLESEGTLVRRGRERFVKVVNGKVIKNEVKNPKPKKISEQSQIKLKGIMNEFNAVYGSVDGNIDIMYWIGPIQNIVKQKRKTPTKELVSELFKTQDGKCNFCNTEVFKEGSSSNCDIDHIIPLYLGGSVCISNLQILCVTCHRVKTAYESRRKKIILPIDSLDLSGLYVTFTKSIENIPEIINGIIFPKNASNIDEGFFKLEY